MITSNAVDISLSTRMVVDDCREDFWLKNIGQLLIEVECNSRPDNGIDAALVHKDFDLFRATSISANEHAVVRTAHSIRTDARDSVFVCLMKKGRGYTYQGVDCVMHVPGDVVFYDTARPYGHGFSSDMEMTVLDISRSVFEEHVRPWHYRSPIKIDHSDGTAGWCAQSIHRMLANDTLPRGYHAGGVLELLHSLLRINDGTLSTTKSTLGSLSRAKAFILQHLTDEGLDCDLVSRAVGLSTRQLARVFELEGVSISRYIWGCRLERCRIDLQSSSLRHLAVNEIAFRWGFNHIPHFCRTYKSRFGETPGATRNTSRSARPQSNGREEGSELT